MRSRSSSLIGSPNHSQVRPCSRALVRQGAPVAPWGRWDGLANRVVKRRVRFWLARQAIREEFNQRTALELRYSYYLSSCIILEQAAISVRLDRISKKFSVDW